MQDINEKYYWQKKSKIKKMYPYLTEDIKGDVVIIGGGICGALTAFFLAEEKYNVIVVEKNILGYGATLTTSAILDYQFDIPMVKLGKSIGTNFTESLYNLSKEAISSVEDIAKTLKNKKIDFKRKDSIYLTNKFINKSILQKENSIRNDFGFDTQFIHSHEFLNFNSAIISKKLAATMDPYMFTQELFAYLDSLDNVRIFENTNVVSIDAKNSFVECTTHNGFKIYTDKLIFTSGIESLRYLSGLDVKLCKTFTIVSKPLISQKYLENEHMNFIARESLDTSKYLRFDDSGRVILTGENLRFNEKFKNDKYMSMVKNDKYKRLLNYLNKVFSIEGEPKLEYEYTSNYIDTKDSLPYVDEIETMPNCFCNLGFGTNGIVFSTIGAKMLKNAVNGLYTKDMKMFRLNR